MKILINSTNKNLEIKSFENMENIHDNFKKFSLIKDHLEVKLIAINELINSHQLSKLKKNFDKINISDLCLYSNNRNTILSGKFLKIASIY